MTAPGYGPPAFGDALRAGRKKENRWGRVDDFRAWVRDYFVRGSGIIDALARARF